MKKAMRFLALWAVLCLLPIPALGEQESVDLTKSCKITSPKNQKNIKRLLDRSFGSVWESSQAVTTELTIQLPDGKTAGGLYLCWGRMPDRWSLSAYTAEGWEIIYKEEGDGYAHVFVPLSGQDRLLLTLQNDVARKSSIGELYVLSPGTPPAWVQQWQPPPDKADLMVLAAHPDDELLYMGGALPYYAGERKLTVTVAYMTCRTNQRRSEMLNGLWAVGVTHYPVIGTFQDREVDSIDKAYRLWGQEETRQFVVGLYRRFRPMVVVSHDVNGEYGHGAHRLCADVSSYALAAAADPQHDPVSAQKYGTWDVPKLYLHLYRKEPLVMDWRQPLAAFAGKTALEVAAAGYAEHRSQHKFAFRVRDTGIYSCAKFGLVRSLVGPDEAKNDFFEHIKPNDAD